MNQPAASDPADSRMAREASSGIFSRSIRNASAPK
jgi:hypothetical protein